MSKISATINVGKRSMMNSQTGLQTVAHNIANKSTEGYTRQRVDFKASTPSGGYGPHQIGTGANTGEIIRINNPHLEKQLELEQQKMGYSDGQTYHLTRIEEVFNDQMNKGVGHFLGEFFNAFRELSNNPESLPIRTQVKEMAENVTKDFKRINASLKDIQKGIDREIEVEVQEINRITSEIADLNLKIANVEVQGFGASANDQRDRRDMLVKKLGEKINVKATEGVNRMITVTAGNTALLVADNDALQLETTNTPERGAKREGSIDVVFRSSKDGSVYNLTDQIKGGKLGSILDIRDKTVNGLLGRLDTMAYTLANKVNEAHLTGYDQYGNPAGEFFQTPFGEKDSSEKLELSKAIKNDVTRIATGAVPNAPGDNRVALVIAALQNQPVMGDKLNTMEDFYKGIVGDIGVITRKSRELNDHQKDVVEQMKNLRESISGVSLDEETIKMIEFQKTFDASANLLKTVDEMLDTVLSLKR